MSAPKVLILGGTEFMGKAILTRLKSIKDEQPESSRHFILSTAYIAFSH